MANAIDSPSRLGLTLQGYDQVIALSQGNINESLLYHFTAKPELCDFNVTLKTQTKEFIKGTLNPPTIELVDIENADQALYILELKKGQYGYWDFSGDEPKRATIPATGWRLAFYVDFNLKKMATVPPMIAEAVQNPGSYSVDQLLVDFGTSDLMSFNWERSKITGFEQLESEISARDTITLFVSKWLGALRDLNSSASHNVLGYAVTVDAEKAKVPLPDLLKTVSPDAPSFPPTSVRLQTINYCPEGDASKTRTDDDRNAFLFTEMTENNPMIVKDLAWSGNFFYDSIGGTMVMSRRIIWDKFLKDKLSKVCEVNLDGAMKEAKARAAEELIKLGGYSQEEESSNWRDQGLGCHRASSIISTGTKDNATVSITFMLQDVIMPHVGQGRVTITHDLDKKREWKDGSKSSYSETKIHWETNVNLKSVTNSGILTAEVVNAEVGEGEPDMQRIAEEALKSVGYAAEFKGAIETALNGQGRFIFPGGGDFDMKDPIFSNAGDLLIGLTLKKGDGDN